MSAVDAIRDRLQAVRGHFGLTQPEMTQRFRLGTGGWQRLEKEGRLPRDEALAELAGAGIDLNWLLTGEGQMRRDTVAETPSAPPTETIDEVVMGRLNDGISAVYKDLGQAIAPVHLGRLAARLYNEVTAAADKPDEIEGAIKMRLVILRAELRAAAVDPLNGKRSMA